MARTKGARASNQKTMNYYCHHTAAYKHPLHDGTPVERLRGTPLRIPRLPLLEAALDRRIAIVRRRML